MSNVLVIKSSARGAASVSNQLVETLLEQWRARDPKVSIKVRDLGANPAPHLSETLLAGWMTEASAQSPAQQAARVLSDELTQELQEADTLVLAAPMYNFTIPSTLKAWFDHVLRAGVTFNYTENGPVGLLEGKRALILTARGGIYDGSALDQQSPYLRQVLGFIGITEVAFIHAEGLNLGAESAEAGLAKAHEAIALYR